MYDLVAGGLPSEGECFVRTVYRFDCGLGKLASHRGGASNSADSNADLPRMQSIPEIAHCLPPSKDPGQSLESILG
jgi:hypothetical protein